MELDTGAEASVVSKNFWELLGRPKLRAAPRLRAYGGKELPRLGMCDVEVVYRGEQTQLPLIFLDIMEVIPLFGKPWITAFNAVSINVLSVLPNLDKLLREHADLFDTSTVGTIKNYTAHLHFKEGAQFRLNKPRPVALALKPRVEAELKLLVKIEFYLLWTRLNSRLLHSSLCSNRTAR